MEKYRKNSDCVVCHPFSFYSRNELQQRLRGNEYTMATTLSMVFVPRLYVYKEASSQTPRVHRTTNPNVSTSSHLLPRRTSRRFIGNLPAKPLYGFLVLPPPSPSVAPPITTRRIGFISTLVTTSLIKLKYRKYGAIADLHTLHFTVTQH
jgi:hypothetical protein